VWFLGAGQWWARHYFDKLEWELDERTLRYRKGILFQIERTIPLENIQDVTFIEGPLLKRFNLATLHFETAGQSASKSGELKLTGIIDAHEFRNLILQRREALRHQAASPRTEAGAVQARDEQVALLKAIAANSMKSSSCSARSHRTGQRSDTHRVLRRIALTNPPGWDPSKRERARRPPTGSRTHPPRPRQVTASGSRSASQWPTRCP
jgi:putative membrane protein